MSRANTTTRSLWRAPRPRWKPPQRLDEFHPLARHRSLASRSTGELWQVQWIWHGERGKGPTLFCFFPPACASLPNLRNYRVFITCKQPATIKPLILTSSFPSLFCELLVCNSQMCGRLMRPETCYFPATTPSTKKKNRALPSAIMQHSLAAARQNLQPRTAPLKGRLMWGEQTGESGRPRGHAKCKGNMTLLQLPNGDITICSATLLRISQLFPRVLREKKKRGKSFSASEFKRNWVWPDHLLFITSVFLVPRVGDKCPESAGKTKYSRMWETVYHRSDVNKESPGQRMSSDGDGC